jgi:hypothetical protein
MWLYRRPQSQHYKYNGNIMHVSVIFEMFGGLFYCRNMWYMGGNHDNKEWDLNQKHPFPKVLGYKRWSDIKEVNITELDCIRQHQILPLQ